MTNFEVLTSITSIQKFSEIIFDILRDKETAKEIEEMLSEEFPEDGLRTLKSLVQKSGYPLSFEGRQ